jgi:hypothetical protein
MFVCFVIAFAEEQPQRSTRSRSDLLTQASPENRGLNYTCLKWQMHLIIEVIGVMQLCRLFCQGVWQYQCCTQLMMQTCIYGFLNRIAGQCPVSVYDVC